jgi:hypothetical protein
MEVTHINSSFLLLLANFHPPPANKSEQLNAAVQYILDTVIQELQLNESRTFSYVEIAFFSRWWKEQSQATQNVVSPLFTQYRVGGVQGFIQEFWLGGGDLILRLHVICSLLLCCIHVFNHLTTVAFLDIFKRKNRRMRL